MLRLLKSIFRRTEQVPGRYPEPLIKRAIERAVDGTDPHLRAVSGYQRRLRPAVLRAVEHVVALVDALPQPVPVRLDGYGEDSRLRSFFISAAHMRKVFREDGTLAAFVGESRRRSGNVVALMAMEKQEKVVFGAEASGHIVARDVRQVSVTFDAHRFYDPSWSEEETRRLLKKRAYDHLLGLALRRLGALKSERSDLERRRTLLQAKLNLLEREGLGFLQDGAEKIDVREIEERLRRIEAQLQALGGDNRVFESYLEVVAEVLGRPEAYLCACSETILLDRMGIKRSDAAEAAEVTLSRVENSEGRSMVVTLVSLDAAELPEPR